MSVGVQAQDELIALLEKTTNEVAQTSSIANELKGLTQSNYIAGENVSRIAAFVKELNGADGGEPIAQGRNKLISLEKEENLMPGAISGIGEKTEEDVYGKLQEALQNRKTLQQELSDVREQIITCQSRAATVTNGDKEFNYGQLCIAYAGKQYASVIEQIRENEAEKKSLINEISALNGILKEKHAELDAEESDVRDLEAHFKNNLDYLETIQHDGGYNETLLKKENVAKLEEKILSFGAEP